MTTFLLKTEPGEFSFADLERAGRTVWEGVANPVALKHMRAAKAGDEALIYHTGAEKAIVGLASILTDAYADPKADDDKSVVFDVAPRKRAASPVSLAQIKADARFAQFKLVRQPRLSVMPVPPALDRAIRSMAGL